MPPREWDGIERRKRSREQQNDHDAVIEVGIIAANNSSAIKILAENMDEKCVTKKEFEPVKNIVYGAVGLILISFLTAILTLVIRSWK